MTTKYDVLDNVGMTSLLEDMNGTLRSMSVDLESPTDFHRVLSESDIRDMYISNLAEGIEDHEKPLFTRLANNVAQSLLPRNVITEMNISAAFNPQARLILPLFRFMWPRLLAKEFLSVIPMDAPEIVRYFFRPVAKKADGTVIQLPSFSPLGMGSPIGTWTSPYAVNAPSNTDLLAAVGLTNATAHLDRKVTFMKWDGLDAAGTSVTGDLTGVVCDEDGKFQFSVEVDTGTHLMDQVSGFVDFEKGVINVSSVRAAQTNGKVTKVYIVANGTTSESNIAVKIGFDHRKITFTSHDLQFQAEWSTQYETDMNKRMGLDMQAEFISVFGNQSQLSTDVYLINEIMYQISRYNTANIVTFDREPSRAAFAHTSKQWAEELLRKIETVSANIFNATNLMAGSHIVCNPADLVWLKLLNAFDFKGSYEKSQGQFGSAPVVGTLSNSMTVLSSPVVPQGNMIIAAKPSQESFANYVYAPYVPITLSPFPLGNVPAMTCTSRFANEMVRPEGFGLIRLVG